MAVKDAAEAPDAGCDGDESRDERQEVGEVEDREGVRMEARGRKEQLGYQEGMDGQQVSSSSPPVRAGWKARLNSPD